MAKKTEPTEIRTAIIWLEKQPEVTSVVKAKWVTSAKHKFASGFTKVVDSDPKHVHLRIFAKAGSKDVFVYAPATALRDRWVAALVGGQVIGPMGPKLYSTLKEIPPDGSRTASVVIPTPKAINDHAGQIFDVTPALATKWLERNTRNRDLRQDVVMRYANDMKAGRWMVTGDAIAFDKNGAIVNGQHRLWAVFEAGITVPMFVTFNLEPEVVRVLDDHLKRKLTDIIKIDHPGININNRMTSASRAMQIASILLHAADKSAAVGRLSRQQQMDFLEKHYEAISFSVKDCFKSSKGTGLLTAATHAVVARAYYSQDHERLKEFGKVFLHGIPNDVKADVAALHLRNWLQKLTATGMRPQTEIVYRKTSRAVMAFCNREYIKTLYEAQNELFYLPEDKAPKKQKAS
jgi:hypothetical protein